MCTQQFIEKIIKIAYFRFESLIKSKVGKRNLPVSFNISNIVISRYLTSRYWFSIRHILPIILLVVSVTLNFCLIPSSIIVLQQHHR